jgi:hypothetical protein
VRVKVMILCWMLRKNSFARKNHIRVCYGDFIQKTGVISKALGIVSKTYNRLLNFLNKGSKICLKYWYCLMSMIKTGLGL